ncbi:auxin-induced protein 15A [Citrus clementina]|nr:auxin-induced protein 15A [Citrus x clementina]
MKKPKKILRLWPFRVENYQGKKHKPSDYDDNLKKMLLLGQLSNGRRDKKSVQRVPKGFLAVHVGPELRRFVIPMAYLSMPEFRVLMDSVAEEYGYEQEGSHLKFPAKKKHLGRYYWCERKCIE